MRSKFSFLIIIFFFFVFIDSNHASEKAVAPEEIIKQKIRETKKLIKILESNKSNGYKQEAIVKYKVKQYKLDKRYRKSFRNILLKEIAGKYIFQLLKLISHIKSLEKKYKFSFSRCDLSDTGLAEAIMEEIIEETEKLISILESNQSRQAKKAAIKDYKTTMQEIQKSNYDIRNNINSKKIAEIKKKYYGKIIKLMLRGMSLMRKFNLSIRKVTVFEKGMKKVIENHEHIIKILESKKSRDYKLKAYRNFKDKMAILKKQIAESRKKITQKKLYEIAFRYVKKTMKLIKRLKILVKMHNLN